MDLRLLKRAALAWLCLVTCGAIGFHTLGGPRWTWLDALYMTVSTMATSSKADFPTPSVAGET